MENQTEVTPEFRARVFAMYTPCMATYESNGAVGMYAMTGVSVAEGMAQFELDEDNDWWNIGPNAKLVLTPVSELSAADAIHISTHILGYRDNLPKDQLIGNAVRLLTNKKGDLAIEAVDYLRSQGYALPFMGVDLFASEIAIKSEHQGERDERSVATGAQ